MTKGRGFLSLTFFTVEQLAIHVSSVMSNQIDTGQGNVIGLENSCFDKNSPNSENIIFFKKN